MQTVLFHLMIQCALWSLMAIGGNTVALGDIHRYTVTQMNWISDAQFVAFFALSQALPGPNGMFLVFIGQQTAGLPGALVALTAKLLPCSMLTWFGAGWLEKHTETPWVQRIKRALLPISVGLILAASYILIRSMETSTLSLLLTLVSAAVVYFSRVNAIWLILAGVGLGLLSSALGVGWF
ncbi:MULTISPECIES: chromate transporter [Pseudomonas]|uniref:Chromate transporter n=1 Tax=Pseudomonas gingeri TaxID=117681 RepID=A0A7Y7WX90_9PSED|nr:MULTISPECIES: chromate transporter [Pseudomonas]MPQ65607.1 chromate transporter [Pseudomonas sp. MWU12-2323]NWB89349.1 chromate transporter [Pseudomonas gingeri]